jgi:DNA repair protein RAD50
VEGELRTIQTELTSASAQSDARAKLDVLRSEISKKEAQREQLISSHGAKFGVLTGQHLDAETDDSVLNKLIRRKNDDVEESARTESAAQSDLTTFEAKIATARDQLKERRRERNEAQKAVMDVSEVGIEGFLGLMSENEERSFLARKQLANLQYAGTFFEKASKDAHERGVCSLCQRELPDEDMDDFLHRMNKNIENVPQKKKELEEELEESESNLAIAKKHLPAYDTYTRLTSTEIPKLESEIKTLTSQLTVSKATLAKHTAAHDTLKTDLRGLENLRRPVGEIARLSKEIEESRREVSRAEAALGEGGRGMSGEEIREKMGRLNEERGRLGREVRVVAGEKEKARSRIQGLREAISGVRVRIGEGESKVVARRGVVRDIEDVKGQMEKARQDIEVLDPPFPLRAPFS